MRSKLLIGGLSVAVTALLATSPIVAEAAGFITSGDIKNSTIKSKDVKNNNLKSKDVKNNNLQGKDVRDGSLTAADMVAQEKQRAQTAFNNGGEGDCIWSNADAEIPGLGGVTYRKDMFSIVRLTGTLMADSGTGGDGTCNPSAAGEVEDGIAFVLPASHIPAKSMVVASGLGGTIIAGPKGITLDPTDPSTALPPGAVYSYSEVIALDGVTFDAAGSSVVLAKTPAASGRATGKLLDYLK